VIANATGCSSIYGGNLPTTPWTFDKNGRGPAWANSLFEDNAEFGLGFRLATDQNQKQAIELMHDLINDIGAELVQEISAHIADNDDAGIQAQRARIAKLKELLKSKHDAKAEQLLLLADFLVKRSIWILGGDGWAYDIGFGGLDHVLASGKNVNVLVLDTEVYSNTGGQASKATPLGAVAKFAASGKRTPAKNLGLMMMSYKYVYVTQIALGANLAQTLKAIKEAENYPGPSLIIAYSHCIAHGINMRLGLHQQELAVNSGYWSLYRYNPELIAQGKNPFILDSKPPSIQLRDYIMHETRFKSLMQSNPEEAKELIAKAQEEINQRFEQYKKMAEEGVN
jgi:pyruvate-ferredoxin/flavodoxin oxidoreductase